MWKLLGIIITLCGASGVLHNWCCEQKDRQKKLEIFILFLKKSLYVMKTEKIRIIDYFRRTIEQDMLYESYGDVSLRMTLEEIIQRLSSNIYPNGQMIWEEVLQEERQIWNLDAEIFRIMVQAGNGFFGHSREENICFLEKSIKELEQQQAKMKEKQAQERKVWIPVGMLGTVMVIIIFL